MRLSIGDKGPKAIEPQGAQMKVTIEISEGRIKVTDPETGNSASWY
jgi:hypothetical protein